MDVFGDYESYILDYKNQHEQINVDYKDSTIRFVPCGFDIETTTQYEKDDKGKVIYHYSNMWIWQFSFGLDGLVFYGRTWDEFSDLLNAIKKVYCIYKEEDKFIFFIHNQNFEQSFMNKEIIARGHTIEVFARKPRHPLRIDIDNFFITLDSYLLTGFSLEKLAKNFTKTQKLTNELDYSKSRHYKTPISDELPYCRNDVLILSEYAQIYYERYLSKGFLPMTSTMIASKVVKDKIKEDKASKEVTNLVANTYPTNQNQYDYLMSFYTGAYTHGMLCNLFNTHKNCLAYDVTSEYPFCMVSPNCYYPVTKWRLIIDTILKDKKLMQNMLNEYCVLVDVTFTNIRTKTGVTILSENKTLCEGARWDNGRLYSADKCECRVCEVDLQTLEMHYEWEDITYNHGVYCHRGKLPHYLRMAICDLYAKKSDYKQRVANGEKELAIELMQSKKDLNGIYGWIVTRLPENELYLDEFGDWKSKDKTNDFNKIRYYKQANPSWSIYITAWSRNLVLGVTKKICDINPKFYLYTDTDSIKTLNKKCVRDIFEEYNKKTIETNRQFIDELELTEKYPNVDFSEMGTFTNETMNHKTGKLEPMRRFKTLGSKRYLSEYANGEIESTVAGLSKKAFLEYADKMGKDPFTLFNPRGLELSEEYSNKLGMFYENNAKTFEVTDYLGNTETIHTESYASLIPITFKMTIKDKLRQIYEYDCYLKGIKPMF